MRAKHGKISATHRKTLTGMKLYDGNPAGIYKLTEMRRDISDGGAPRAAVAVIFGNEIQIDPFDLGIIRVFFDIVARFADVVVMTVRKKPSGDADLPA